MRGSSGGGGAGTVSAKLSPDTCSRHAAGSVREVLALLQRGARRKVTAATALNMQSSRGHTVFHVTVRRTLLRSGGGGGGSSGD